MYWITKVFVYHIYIIHTIHNTTLSLYICQDVHLFSCISIPKLIQTTKDIFNIKIFAGNENHLVHISRLKKRSCRPGRQEGVCVMKLFEYHLEGLYTSKISTDKRLTNKQWEVVITYTVWWIRALSVILLIQQYYAASNTVTGFTNTLSPIVSTISIFDIT